MNKTLKIVLIVLAAVIAVIIILFLIQLAIDSFVNKWVKSYVPSSNSETCAQTICKKAGADNSYYNESDSLCICYRQGQIIKQTKISS